MTLPKSRIALSLVSHTNAGKTTLMRTLLGRDIGEVRDAAHVTEVAEGWPLVADDDAELWLWDTPGFGDSLRLARRLEGSAQPILGLLRETWDRFADRPFWCSQQAVKNVREEADVVLYLVNAAEAPATAGYIDPELRVLGWIGKPVIVALNQMGAPRAAAEEAAEVERWRQRMAAFPLVRGVLPLDAFARCWVQESALWDLLQASLPADAQPRMARLHRAWRAQRESVFERSSAALADFVHAVAGEREAVEDGGLSGRVREFIAAAVSRGAHDSAELRAQARLFARAQDAASACLRQLVELHGLDGGAQVRIEEELSALYDLRAPLDEGKAALFGGALSGALLGLKADLASGGLSFGAGVLLGGVLGALGAAGIARGVNRVRGTETPVVSWTAEALDRFTRDALLRYLAVAHFGRGRGAWRETGAPVHWGAVVDAALAKRQAELAAARTADDAQALHALLGAALREVLSRLHPAATGA